MNKTMLLFSEKNVLLLCVSIPTLEKKYKTRHSLASPFIPQDAVYLVTSQSMSPPWF